MTELNPRPFVGSENQGYNLSSRFCMPVPPYVNSNGIWQFIGKAGNHPWDASLPRLELQIIVAFAVTHACHFVLKRFGIPMIASQITVCALQQFLSLWCIRLIRNFVFDIIYHFWNELNRYMKATLIMQYEHGKLKATKISFQCSFL